MVAASPEPAAHIPVLLRPLLQAVAPVGGVWLDGTFGAGGYARGLLAAGAARVIGVDRDPTVFQMAQGGTQDDTQGWAQEFGDRLILQEGTFSQLDTLAAQALGLASTAPAMLAPMLAPMLDGVVLDLGVSSMQIDQAARGFSFMKDGPLDMRMSQTGRAAGPSAADLVNTASEEALADILFHYGEERASRRIARKIVQRRIVQPFETTLELSELVASCLPRPKPGQSHAATRSFQALRIAVNDEFGQLLAGLEAAERALKPGGKLAIVSFHSLEDRVVKRFLQARSGTGAGGSRYAPERPPEPARFALTPRRGIGPDQAELAENPRARSAILRVATRSQAPAGPAPTTGLGMPKFNVKDRL